MRKAEKSKKFSSRKIRTMHRDHSLEIDPSPIANPSKALLAALNAVERMGKTKNE